MKSIRVPIRAIGNSRGIVIPKLLLAQAGLEATADLTVKSGAIVVRKPAVRVRDGWADAAQLLAEQGGDFLVMDEFANADDVERVW